MPLICVYLSLCALGAAPDRPRYGGTLRLSFAESMDTYYPATAQTLPERTIARAVYENLVRLDDREQPQPDLAEHWRMEAEGKRWTLELRSGVRFHNDAPLNAAAVRVSLERAMVQPRSAGPAALRAAQFACSVISAAALTCVASQALPALPAILADPALSIAHEDGAGTGPFQVAEYTPGARVKLEAFAPHHRGRPFLDSVEIEFGKDARRLRADFELKRADIAVLPAVEARALGGARPSPLVNLLVLGFPRDGGLLLAQRSAIIGAVQRDALAELLPPGRAEAALAYLPAALSGYAVLFYAPYPAKLEQPLPPQRIVFDAHDAVAQRIVSRLVLDLRGAGVELQPAPLPRAAFLKAKETAPLYAESVRLKLEAQGASITDLGLRVAKPESLVDFLGRGLDEQYDLENRLLNTKRLFPLIHWRDAWAFQPGLEHVRLGADGFPDLANSWLARER
jgi:hypothetical protein